MIRILFLCHGNICRSPRMRRRKRASAFAGDLRRSRTAKRRASGRAEFVMKELVRRADRSDIVVESAALHTDEIGSGIHYGARSKLRAMGIPFAPRAAWLLNAAKAREYDHLVGMDDVAPGRELARQVFRRGDDLVEEIGRDVVDNLPEDGICCLRCGRRWNE